MRISYYLKALYRRYLLWRYHEQAIYGTYDHPEKVMGYTGWWDVPGYGVVAFTHQNGKTQYRW